jgi:diguanylate cyclase (GGDEF)-like protein
VIENTAQGIVLKDLNSTNGTYVNDHQIKEHNLVDGDQIKVGSTIFKFLTGSNIETAYHDEIYRLTTIDGLTQVYNKRHFLKELEREMSRSMRHQRHLSLIICDIDHFKSINDTYGHLAGDYVLKKVAQRIAYSVRQDDVFARYGGEEFAMMLPELDRPRAVHVAEKLRRIVEEEQFVFDHVTIKVTMSFGVADLVEYMQHARVIEVDGIQTREANYFAFIKIADDRLYQAKHGGRNRVVG